jgi:pyruvate formate lyase activating enzyme
MTKTLTRRRFIRDCAAFGLGCWATAGIPRVFAGGEGKSEPAAGPLKEAAFWEPAGKGKVRCTTCPNLCERGEGEITRCKTRINKGGKLYSLTYAKPCLLHADPLAKNPLYHVDIGATAIGTATAGCNLSCAYCQNWDISQCGPDKTKNMDLSPGDLVADVKSRGLRWITFSYTEPVAYVEYALDVATLAHQKGVKIAIATAGYICDKPLAELIKHTDAFSVTFKGNSEQFYRDVCGCGVDAVRNSITAIARSGKWMEIATLIIPGRNDGDSDIKSMARFIAGLNRNIPVHYLRFAPAYHMANLPPTPQRTLETAHKIARQEGLKFVYIDLPGHEASATYCSSCGKSLVERSGFTIVQNRLKNGSCPYCSQRLPGIV